MENQIEAARHSSILMVAQDQATSKFQYNVVKTLEFPGVLGQQRVIKKIGQATVSTGHEDIVDIPKFGLWKGCTVRIKVSYKNPNPLDGQHQWVVFSPNPMVVGGFSEANRDDVIAGLAANLVSFPEVHPKADRDLLFKLFDKFEWRTKSGNVLNTLWPEIIKAEVMASSLDGKSVLSTPDYIDVGNGEPVILSVPPQQTAETYFHIPLTFPFFKHACQWPDLMSLEQTVLTLKGNPNFAQYFRVVEEALFKPVDNGDVAPYIQGARPVAASPNLTTSFELLLDFVRQEQKQHLANLAKYHREDSALTYIARNSFKETLGNFGIDTSTLISSSPATAGVALYKSTIELKCASPVTKTYVFVERNTPNGANLASYLARLDVPNEALAPAVSGNALGLNYYAIQSIHAFDAAQDIMLLQGKELMAKCGRSRRENVGEGVFVAPAVHEQQLYCIDWGLSEDLSLTEDKTATSAVSFVQMSDPQISVTIALKKSLVQYVNNGTFGGVNGDVTHRRGIDFDTDLELGALVNQLRLVLVHETLEGYAIQPSSNNINRVIAKLGTK